MQVSLLQMQGPGLMPMRISFCIDAALTSGSGTWMALDKGFVLASSSVVKGMAAVSDG